jgi:hypothetical protein
VVRLAFLGNEVLDLDNAHVTLLDFGGSFVDFNHEQLVHTASADGTYFIAVDDGSGTTEPTI